MRVSVRRPRSQGHVTDEKLRSGLRLWGQSDGATYHHDGLGHGLSFVFCTSKMEMAEVVGRITWGQCWRSARQHTESVCRDDLCSFNNKAIKCLALRRPRGTNHLSVRVCVLGAGDSLQP